MEVEQTWLDLTVAQKMLARLCLLHSLVLDSNKDPSPIEPVENQPEEYQG
jgi:hypothetical protein